MVDRETDNELRECWSCGMTQPDWPNTLHLEECPDHDEETCLVCLGLDDDAQSGGT